MSGMQYHLIHVGIPGRFPWLILHVHKSGIIPHLFIRPFIHSFIYLLMYSYHRQLRCRLVPRAPRDSSCFLSWRWSPSHVIIMSPLYRGGDILLFLEPLISSPDQFCVCAFSPSIVQAVKLETLTQCQAIVGSPSTTLSQH